MRYMFIESLCLLSRSFLGSFNFGILWLALIASASSELSSAQSSDLWETHPKQQVLGVPLTRELHLKGVSIPLGQPNAGVLLRCAEVRVVSKQIGMMRIGLIPALEVSEMSWEIRGEIPASKWCGMVMTLFQSEPLLGQSHFEGFSLVFNTTKNFRLESKAAHIESERNVLLIEKPSVEIGGESFRFHSAELLLEGDRAGKLLIAISKSHRIYLDLPLDTLPLNLHDKIHNYE